MRELLDRIAAAPAGPGTLAAFDLDGTLVHGYTARAFLEHRLVRGQVTPADLVRGVGDAARRLPPTEAFDLLMERSVAAWKDVELAELQRLGDKLFRDRIGGWLHRECWAALEAHRAAGHTIVLASSALPFQTAPIARELGIEHVVDTQVEVRDGRLTGRTEGPAAYGARKAEAVVALAGRLGGTPAFGYSNGREDVPLLEAVGHPVAVAPDRELRRVAEQRGWEVLECAAPPGLPGPRTVARTAGFYGGLLGVGAAALATGLTQRSRRAAVDLATGAGCDVALAMSGVDVRVVAGAEHLWSHRPAVFVFNHASKLDPFVLGKLIRTGLSGIAKHELRHDPILRLAGVTFLDRGDARSAIKALAPVVEQLRDGTSIAVAPEGTRSPTPRIGPFKKGPFHIAMQARVPVVPVVLRGVDQAMWRMSNVIRPAVVEVQVLAPVDTFDWRPETVGEHRDHVRDLMVAAFADWPQPAELAAGGA